MEDLSQMTKAQLVETIEEAKQILLTMEADEKGVHAFSFEATSDFKKGFPYIALLGFDGSTITREFIDLARSRSGNNVTVCGDYEASTGDLLEICPGGQKKKKSQIWVVITPTGDQFQVAGVNDSAGKMKATAYLKEEISLTELLAQCRQPGNI